MRGVLPFAFDGDFLLSEDVELALRVGLLIDLAAFGHELGKLVVEVLSAGERLVSELRKSALHTDNLDAVADRGYFKGEEILACEKAGITVTLPKPQTSGAKSEGRFGKPDFVYLPAEDVYRCPAGEKLTYRYTTEEDGQNLRRYWTSACLMCPIKDQCTTGKERRITRWEHEHVVEAVQTRLVKNPQAMTHFLMKRLKNVATEMALNVLSYNLTRVMNIVGVKPLLAAMRA